MNQVCVEYMGANSFRTTSAEKRELERLASYDYEKIRKAGEVQTRFGFLWTFYTFSL